MDRCRGGVEFFYGVILKCAEKSRVCGNKWWSRKTEEVNFVLRRHFTKYSRVGQNQRKWYL